MDETKIVCKSLKVCLERLPDIESLIATNEVPVFRRKSKRLKPSLKKSVSFSDKLQISFYNSEQSINEIDLSLTDIVDINHDSDEYSGKDLLEANIVSNYSVALSKNFTRTNLNKTCKRSVSSDLLNTDLRVSHAVSNHLKNQPAVVNINEFNSSTAIQIENRHFMLNSHASNIIVADDNVNQTSMVLSDNHLLEGSSGGDNSELSHKTTHLINLPKKPETFKNGTKLAQSNQNSNISCMYPCVHLERLPFLETLLMQQNKSKTKSTANTFDVIQSNETYVENSTVSSINCSNSAFATNETNCAETIHPKQKQECKNYNLQDKIPCVHLERLDLSLFGIDTNYGTDSYTCNLRDTVSADLLASLYNNNNSASESSVHVWKAMTSNTNLSKGCQNKYLMCNSLSKNMPKSQHHINEKMLDGVASADDVPLIYFSGTDASNVLVENVQSSDPEVIVDSGVSLSEEDIVGNSNLLIASRIIELEHSYNFPSNSHVNGKAGAISKKNIAKNEKLSKSVLKPKNYVSSEHSYNLPYSANTRVNGKATAIPTENPAKNKKLSKTILKGKNSKSSKNNTAVKKSKITKEEMRKKQIKVYKLLTKYLKNEIKSSKSKKKLHKLKKDKRNLEKQYYSEKCVLSDSLLEPESDDSVIIIDDTSENKGSYSGNEENTIVSSGSTEPQSGQSAAMPKKIKAKKAQIDKFRLGFLSKKSSLRFYNRFLASERLLSKYQIKKRKKKEFKKLFKILKTLGYNSDF